MQVADGVSLQIRPNQTILMQTEIGEDFFKLVSRFLFINNQWRGIYVSSNRSAKDLTEKVQAYDFDLGTKLRAGQIFVVDLVSRSVGDHEIEGTVCVPSPSELSATQMAIEKIINRFSSDTNSEPKNTWLIIDSLPTLLIFNGAGALLNFLHFLIGRLRVLGYTGIIFTSEGSLNRRVFSTVAQLCDTVIKSNW